MGINVGRVLLHWAVHSAEARNSLRFIHATAPATKNTESWSQSGSARRHQSKTAKEYYFGKREVAETDPKMGPPRGPIFVTAQNKTQPDKRSPRFLLHILERECLLRL